MDLSSIIYIYDQSNLDFDDFSICIKDFYKGGPSFFDDYQFNSGNFKI